MMVKREDNTNFQKDWKIDRAKKYRDLPSDLSKKIKDQRS